MLLPLPLPLLGLGFAEAVVLGDTLVGSVDVVGLVGLGVPVEPAESVGLGRAEDPPAAPASSVSFGPHAVAVRSATTIAAPTA
ncbi:hypothetical protein [Streptomyces roseicoloratus]|uniref:Secreted protein n=1 Tax=Streptomyces roseicoloratus TaxID=2508722 RepID=A0ABY9RR79_9ACTN|nr:hypothetical protein [Streptomyces roseicoloratus]WMX44447.1 hypothetical protein RGF97_05655 [Streptomyces roseicoloratus]